MRWVMGVAALAAGCSWMASLPDIRLDRDTVRQIAEAIGVDGATVQFELRCTAVNEVATCDVVGSTSVVPGELVTRIAKDIGTDVLSGKDVGVRCTVVVADASATSCEIDVGNGWQEVPVDDIGGDPGDDGPPPGATEPPGRDGPDRDRAGKRGPDRDKAGKAGKGGRDGADRARGGTGDRSKREGGDRGARDRNDGRGDKVERPGERR